MLVSHETKRGNVITAIKKQLLGWVLVKSDAGVYEQIFRDRPEMVLSVTRHPYGDMLIRFVDGRELEAPTLPEGFLDQLIGFERDTTESHPTWINIFSVVAVNAAIETRALRVLMMVADRLGYELRETPRRLIEGTADLGQESGAVSVAFVDGPATASDAAEPAKP